MVPSRVTARAAPGSFQGRGQPACPGSIRPCSYPYTTAWTRSRSPSLSRTWVMWVLTVLWLITNSRAISSLDRPRITRSSTSRSRGVSRASSGGSRAGGGRRAANSASSLLVTGGQQRAAVGGRPYAEQQFLRRRVLAQEATGPRPQRLVHVLIQVIGGKNDHLSGGATRLAVPRGDDLPGGGQPVQHRHPDVHQHHVGSELAGEPGRLPPVARLPDHLQVRLAVQQRRQARPHQGLVVGDQHPDRAAGGHASSGTVLSGQGIAAVTANPPPGRGPASRRPP